MGPDGLISHHEFKTLGGKYVEPHRRVYEGYKHRQSKWDIMEKDNKKSKNGKVAKDFQEATCPKCNMDWIVPTGENVREYFCNKAEKGCGHTLVPLTRVN
jgi:hypothetical protein